MQGPLFIDDRHSAQVGHTVKGIFLMVLPFHTRLVDPSSRADNRSLTTLKDVRQVNESVETTSVTEQGIQRSDRHLSTAACSKDMAVPSLYQPAKGSMFQELFLDYFISRSTSANKQRRHTDWVYQLSSFIQHPETKSITSAIRAATMALYGKKTGNESLQLEACRVYSKGLQSQIEESRANQSKLTDGKSPDLIFTEQDICAPILFCIFETAMSTAFDAWAQHLMAGCKILEMLGPEKCQQGMYHSLLRFVRAGAVRSCLSP